MPALRSILGAEMDICVPLSDKDRNIPFYNTLSKLKESNYTACTPLLVVFRILVKDQKHGTRGLRLRSGAAVLGRQLPPRGMEHLGYSKTGDMGL
ncbi:hypothetical protein Zmor_007415 [Zophobas morio]|uniref:Uncharacterized protein n=1 Tax=Zophobas morio TaxID=2755281 RepID=A0AA38IXB9_9CUCU|nr:hypothetical protein Zmor_007415 [Zophobas morio]